MKNNLSLGEVLNGEEQINELRQSESLLSALHDAEDLLETKSGKDTSKIEAPLIDFCAADFVPSAPLSYRSSSKVVSIHSNLLDGSVEDLNDISLGDVAAPEDCESGQCLLAIDFLRGGVH
jgi:hypothetical protein